MTVYFVDDGGSATAPYDTWAKAATSLSALDDAVSFASGDIVYIGHDHVCQYVHAAARTITGPTSGIPTYLISVTQGSDPPTYEASTTNQVDTSEGVYGLTFDGAFSYYGVCFKSGAHMHISNDANEGGVLVDVTLRPGFGHKVTFDQHACRFDGRNVTLDFAADSSNTSGDIASFRSRGSISGLRLLNAGYRTGAALFATDNNSELQLTGVNATSLTNATVCELFSGSFAYAPTYLSNCKTAATWSPQSGSISFDSAFVMMSNCGPADSPTYLYFSDRRGVALSSSDIYRTGGGTVEDVACSWLITTTAYAAEGAPFYSPWMYGTVEAGARTFDVYITNDTADFTDAEVWLEVEYLSTADEPQWELASDQRATITATAAAQADDTASTWNGSGPSFTYKQKLSVAATVGESGQYRARVAVGKASIASSSYFYVDPLVTVT